MKSNHFLFLSLFALLSLSVHGFEHEHEHDSYEEESEEFCITCHLIEVSVETNELDADIIFTQSIYLFSKKENLNNFKTQNKDVRAPPIG